MESSNRWHQGWYKVYYGCFIGVCIRSDQEDRFQLYLDKTFNKTASLMAYSCKSVAILASEGADDKTVIVRY